MNEHATAVPDCGPPDAAARQQIRSDLSSTLFVAAGAGSGKTASLVARIVELIGEGTPIGTIAAITFTEKAAAELRHRLRGDLVEAASDPSRLDRQLLVAALADLDHAPIGTLHAFARRLLNEYPIAAGLPPGFTVLDELAGNIDFDERWDDLLDQLLDQSATDESRSDRPGGSELVQLCSFDGFGVQRGFRRVAVEFQTNWDLVARHVDCVPPPAWRPDTRLLLSQIESVIGTAAPEHDRQFELLSDLAHLARQLDSSSTTLGVLTSVAAIATRAGAAPRTGNKSNWKGCGGEPALAALRQLELQIAAEAQRLIDAACDYRKRLVGAILGQWVLDSAASRAAEGTLVFHDLLVFARQLLATHSDVRAALHRRYQRLLLDEFQDTDPIQLELAVRLAAAPDDPAQTGDWRRLSPLPGRLFIVGDPKQSIYRFRRADIAQYLATPSMVDATQLVLSANFRSSEVVISWINHVFAQLITEQPDTQPPFQPLVACRPRHLMHGSVTVLGAHPHESLADQRSTAEEIRWLEASEAAEAVATALHTGWLVGDPTTHLLRPCTPGDITILLPARTSLAALETALRERDIPYRAENSSVVYATTEIRHLMLTLRAADDSTDELALLAALRSPLYGCSDVELFDWRRRGGTWSLFSTPPSDLADHPVAEAISHVRSLAERVGHVSAGDLVAALVDERRVLDCALDAPDGRDVWRRVRYVIEQARAWSDAGGHGLRRYLSWVRLQATESHTADTVLPEHDHDAVRIMTIHAAKGLEFPIALVTGLTTVPAGRSRNSVVWHNDDWTIAGHDNDELYDDFKPIDEQMSDAERRRLLYVACTRAVDHLVVSLHRIPSKSDKAPNRLPSAALLASAGAASPESGASIFVADPGAFSIEPRSPAELEWADPAAWAAERSRALRSAGRRLTVSATRLADDLVTYDDPGATDDEGLRKDAVDLELPPWQRGRYGTAVGRAVHGVLQFCDLATGHDIDALAAAQCAAEGIIGLDDTVAALARSALRVPILREAIVHEHHRELFVAAPFGERVLEGYVDLLVHTPAGYVVVDYKTDAWRAGADRNERIVRYRRQLAAYAVALEQVLGEPVVAGVLVRCRSDADAEQIELDGWPDAVADLRAMFSV